MVYPRNYRFLVLVLQLATMTLVSGRGGGHNKDRLKTTVLTADLQTALVDMTPNHKEEHIKIEPSIVSNFDCTFELKLLSSNNCSTPSAVSIIVKDKNGRDIHTYKCGSENNGDNSIYELTEVKITTSGSSNESNHNFKLQATLYSCPGRMMTWTFVITRSLVAVIFVLIPTLVVFLLFYRRQVAIHRARLLQEAELARRRNYAVAVIDMSEIYKNDTPPTYEDVYDTKEPPPCFCQAIGVNPAEHTTTDQRSTDAPGGRPAGSNSIVVDCPCRRLQFS